MHYDVIGYKSILEAPHRLTDCEEAQGELLRIFDAEGQCIAVFSWGAISLPLDLREELADLVGHEIAVLRLDGRYHVRVVDDA
ncbi:MAG: hypothetical protein A4E49_00018 [Methanosaeta sp. PtaU1.Bin112]|nr:MAG: hypothetical protein A4E49_00018 [Methanosaeta sp. PtaU1.Bin112]